MALCFEAHKMLPQMRVLDYQELIVSSGSILKASNYETGHTLGNLPLSVSILTTLSTAVKIQMGSASET